MSEGQMREWIAQGLCACCGNPGLAEVHNPDSGRADRHYPMVFSEPTEADLKWARLIVRRLVKTGPKWRDPLVEKAYNETLRAAHDTEAQSDE